MKDPNALMAEEAVAQKPYQNPQANLDQEGPEADFINQLVTEAVEYVHVENRDKVAELLSKSSDTAGTMGAITYKLTRGLIEKHKKQGMSLDIEMDTAMGVATEVIDMLMEIQGKLQTNTPMNEKKVREDALLHVVMQHAESLSDDDISKEDAAVMLRQYMQDGSVDQAFGYVNKRAEEEGINVNDMIRRGNDLREMATQGAAPQRTAQSGPQQTPLAEGIQQGLMEG